MGPFTFHASFPVGDRLVATTGLDRLELELRRVLALTPCEESIDVYVSRDAREHRALLAERCPGTPYRRAIFYRRAGRASVFTYHHNELAIDLRHEATHALLHADLPMVPLWLDEGLAEYFEAPQPRRAQGLDDRLGRVVEAARRGVVPDLRRLEERRELSDFSGRDYRDAWAWTHFLLHGPREATSELWAMLAALRRWEPPGTLSERLAKALPDPRRSFVRHFDRWPGVLHAARAGSPRR
ncbi:MAG: DUF1570 domain-containing protein [Planctomycetota bacterium]